MPAVPLLAATPAYAADNVICVNLVDPSCADTQASIGAAISAADGNTLDDTILVGPGTYTDGPYQLLGTTHAITLRGSGPGTNITVAPNGMQTYIGAHHATVADLTVTLDPAAGSSSSAIYAGDGSVVDNVTVVGAGASNVNGLHVKDSQVVSSSVEMALGAGTRGMYVEGGSTVTDTTITGDTGVYHSGTTADTFSRISITDPTFAGVWTDGGTVDIDNAVIDLGSTGGTGLLVQNSNNSTATKAINADHVTIVGGNGSSEGAWAWAARPVARQSAALTLTNSIVRGPAVSLRADAGNDGAQGGDSTATVDVSHTDYQTTGGTIGANGTGGVIAGAGNVDVDPAFVDLAGGDLHLSPGSPVIDQGDTLPGPPGELDRDGAKRVVDGDANGTAVRDMGAFEFPDTIAPVTTITSGPSGSTRDTTPTFGFAGGADASYECQVDAGAYAACTSPFTTAALANGTHTFRVKATDAAANTDATPATRGFTVDTVAPNTTFTRKPAKTTTKKRVRFAFTSSESGSRFECRLDKGSWRACVSPKAVRVKKGRHVFLVRAIDAAGNVDATPALYRFRRV